MTQTEALKLALEALEDWNSPLDPQPDADIIAAIKEALAQPEQRSVSKHLEPVAWKLVPVEPTEEMLKEMDKCSKEGYDERLYAGHAASVYMAAVDVAPTPPQRKTLTFEQVEDCFPDGYSAEDNGILVSAQWLHDYARAIEAAHGIKK